MQPHHVFVLTDRSGRRFALGSLPGRGLVLDDLDEGRTLGEANADLTPFVITIGDAPHVVFAGPRERPQHRFTVIDGHSYPVKNGVWMSFPEPFKPAMQITAIWQDEHEHELFRLTSPPLRADALEPMFGPGWTQYAPR